MLPRRLLAKIVAAPRIFLPFEIGPALVPLLAMRRKPQVICKRIHRKVKPAASEVAERATAYGSRTVEPTDVLSPDVLEITVPAAASEPHASIADGDITAVTPRERRQKIGRQAPDDCSFRLIEGTEFLRLPREQHIGLIAIHEDLGRLRRHPREIRKVQSVVRVQPNVRNQPVVRRRQ
jgi:hypothetical protein